MSKAPAPKGNLIQTMLIALVLFLGFQTFFGQRPVDPRSAADVLKEMRKMSREIKDISIAAELPKYESKVHEEALAKKTPPDQVDAAILEGIVLTADTQSKAAIQRSDINRATAAYMTIHNRRAEFETKPAWKQTIQLEPHPQFPQAAVTPAVLHEKVIQELSTRNKTDLVFGLASGYQIIDFLVSLTGKVPSFSYAFAALLLAIVVRAVVWPLTQKQLMFSRQMMQLKPLVDEIKEKHKGSPQEMQVETMALYKTYGINPMAGCFPALLQMPLFFFVYQCMVHYRFEFRNGTFLWINPHTAAGSSFIAPNLGEMDKPLLVIYGITMISSTLLAPISDPAQAKQQRLMGLGVSVFMTIMMFFWPLPSAFVLYWICTNLLSTIQSLRAYRMPVPPLVKVNAPNGAVYPTGSNGSMTNGHSEALFKKTGAPKTQKPKKKK